MPKPLQFSIDQPCHEKWTSMTPVEKGRYCASCEKPVVDFTDMSDAQLVAFFRKPATGGVCGRFMKDQLNRDMFIPKKRVPWFRYFFQIVLPAFLFSSRAVAQGDVKVKLKTATTFSPMDHRMQMGDTIIRNQPRTATQYVQGTVLDKDGGPIPMATVMLKGTVIGTNTDTGGHFRLSIPPGHNNATFELSAIGFTSLDVKIDPSDQELGKVHLFRLSQSVTGEVVIVSTRSKKAERSNFPPLKQDNMDTAQSKFTIYPNPVAPGMPIHIGLQQIEDGYYRVSFISDAGRLEHQNVLWIDKEASVMTMDLPALPAGHYVVTLTNKKTKKRFTDKILIE